MKEAAIAAAKDRSKGELRLRQRWEYARRLEGAGATTADGTDGDDDHVRTQKAPSAAGGWWSRD